MRQFATGLNRTWLTVIGLLLALAGLGAVALGTGLWARVGGGGPTRDDTLVGDGLAAVFASAWAAAAVGAVGVAFAVCGLAWLFAQIPRTNAARPFRLEDDALTGLTVCAPAVLTDAVSADVQAITGVTAADAVLRGTASEPELTLRFTANDRTDIRAILDTVRARAVPNLQTAMGAPLRRLAIQVDISSEKRTTDHLTL